MLFEVAGFESNRLPPGDNGLDVFERGPLLTEEPKMLPVFTARVGVVGFVASG